MGFYSPQSLVHDARRHGIEVRGVDINASGAQATLEPTDRRAYTGPGPQQPAVRLALSSVRTISKDLAERIAAIRDTHGPYTNMAELARRVGLSTDQVEALATAGAFDSLGLARRSALWSAGSAAANRPGQLDITPGAGQPPLPPMTEPEQLIADLWATGITRDHYPTALIRDRLDALGVTPAAQLKTLDDHTRVLVGGIVTHRQRPASAGGVTFLSLEDETGLINVICPQVVFLRTKRGVLGSSGLLVRGMLERSSGAVNVVAERIEKLNLGMRSQSRDFG